MSGKTPLVELDGNVLYQEDLLQVLLVDISEADSAQFANRYIENWLSELLLYQNAERNVRDDKQIDELVEKKFEGSLPAFIAAFTKGQELSEKELDEVQNMIDRIRKGGAL